MSYEKKIKDLMARLVSMSPEPPPFPEEMPVARQKEEKRARPVLVFAAAAAFVALLAVPLLLFTGEPDPTVIATTSTTTVPQTSTTDQRVTTTTTPVESTTTTTPATAWTGTVFLYQTPENSNLSNPALVPVSLTLNGDVTADTSFTEALAAVGPEIPGLSYPLVNAVPADVAIVSQSSMETDTGFVLTFDMNEAFLDGAGGLLADTTMLNQLIYTATEPYLEGAEVIFTVNGEPVEQFGSEGLSLSEPVNRETFREGNLHSIYLTSPITPQEDGSYLVEGITQVFEGTVQIAVLDGDGEVVHEEFVTATCGTGCWGEFSTSIDPQFITPGESSVRVFQYSARDGSIVDAVTVPIPTGGSWQYTVDS